MEYRIMDIVREVDKNPDLLNALLVVRLGKLMKVTDYDSSITEIGHEIITNAKMNGDRIIQCLTSISLFLDIASCDIQAIAEKVKERIEKDNE